VVEHVALDLSRADFAEDAVARHGPSFNEKGRRLAGPCSR
jgi:hypothetical protein